MSEIEHPRHYNVHPSGVEAILLCEQMMFNTGNAVKYLMRAGEKTPDVAKDLKKALWYVEREISRRNGRGFIRRVVKVFLKRLPRTDFSRQDAYRVLWSRVLDAETRESYREALWNLYQSEKSTRTDNDQRASLALAALAIREELAAVAS